MPGKDIILLMVYSGISEAEETEELQSTLLGESSSQRRSMW